VPFDLVNGIIAGGDIAIRKAVENGGQCLSGWKDLQEHKISQ
jgi:N-acetylmuramic acid 6-phosphate etherase